MALQEELYLRRVAELDAVTEIRNRQRSDLERFVKTRVTEFLDGFYKITYKLKEIYQMITLGGDAELELVDSLNPFSEGIMFRCVISSVLRCVTERTMCYQFSVQVCD